jgi:acetyl esterase/lipase
MLKLKLKPNLMPACVLSTIGLTWLLGLPLANAQCPFNVGALAGAPNASLLADGLLLNRYAIRNASGAPSFLTTSSGSALTAASISDSIKANNVLKLDVNGNGKFEIDDAVIIVRYLAGLRGAALQPAVAGATRSGDEVQSFIEGGCVAPAAQICPVLDTSDLTPENVPAPACTAFTRTTLSYIPAPPAGGTIDANHTLELFRPTTGAGPFRTVIFIHGGGWRQGDALGSAGIATRMVCRGYAVASVNYRLSQTALFPAQIQDVQAAIRYLRANAATLNLDPNRFASFGNSAGGHLAALVATSAGVAGFEDATLGNPGVSSAVQAAMAWFGPSDFSQMDPQILAQGCSANDATHNGPGSFESLLVGCTVGSNTPECNAKIQSANPVSYVGSNTPPIYVMHGRSDCTVPIGQSALVKYAAESAGRCAYQRTVLRAGHGGDQWLSAPVQQVVPDFFDVIFGSP